ncbi:hypothetical protein ACP4OV_014717 [Aristida adscensionis]
MKPRPRYGLHVLLQTESLSSSVRLPPYDKGGSYGVDCSISALGARSWCAFTVTTWTLRLGAMDDGEPMAWVKDGVLDCEELWALPGYEGLPRVQPWRPTVSLDNPGAARLVVVAPRCCCGGPGTSTCARSESAFTVTTWTLRLGGAMDGGGEPVAWVKDGVLDCEELWAQPGYEGLPRVLPWCPVVSSDNPDVVWFEVMDLEYSLVGGRKEWMIEVDTRRKALLSVVGLHGSAYTYLPSKLGC